MGNFCLENFRIFLKNQNSKHISTVTNMVNTECILTIT